MRYEARFVVETHAHITSLYKPKGEKGWDRLTKGELYWTNEELEYFDNSGLCLYDMERYGVDMCLLKASAGFGSTNEAQAALVDKYPDKFRAFCNAQTLKDKIHRGEAQWSLDAAAEEVATALNTGKFIGIGEFIPSRAGAPWSLKCKEPPTFNERLNEYRTFAELARKYGVTIDFHDFACRYPFNVYVLLARIASEYPDVPIILCHGGYSIGGYSEGASIIRKACAIAGNYGRMNIYLETGTWPAEYFEIALKDPNVGAPPASLGRRLRPCSPVHRQQSKRKRPIHVFEHDEEMAAGAFLPDGLVGLVSSPDTQNQRQCDPG